MTSTSFEHFSVHDVSEFPVVWTRADALEPGYASQWAKEMDTLLAHGQIFVPVMPYREQEEDHADRKARAIWLKQNKQALAQHCRAGIGVEPNTVKRLAMQAQAAVMGKAFGIQMEMVESNEAARAAALRLLTQG